MNSLARWYASKESSRGSRHRISRILYLTIAISILAANSPPASSSAAASVTSHGLNQLAPGDHEVSVNVGARIRTFILHVPPNPVIAHRPLILVFHGADDTPSSTIQETDFEQVADDDGELVAFLQGYDNTWNEGTGTSAAALAHVNDVAFTQTVITKIEDLVTFNHARIAAAGFSNGALMVQYLGCRLAQKLALIVPIEGELPLSDSASCDPSRPISVYEVHGTADTAIPYNGGQFVGVAGGTTVLSAPASVSRWAHLDRCAATPTSTTPTTGITLTTYHGCLRGVTVVLETIANGIHEWTPSIGELVTQALSTA